MSIKQQVEKLASEKGVSVEIKGGRFFTVELSAPFGYSFGGEIHQLVSEGEQGGKSRPDIAWLGALRDLKNNQICACPSDCICRE